MSDQEKSDPQDISDKDAPAEQIDPEMKKTVILETDKKIEIDEYERKKSQIEVHLEDIDMELQDTGKENRDGPNPADGFQTQRSAADNYNTQTPRGLLNENKVKMEENPQ